MLHFFRKKRWRLAAENQFLKYTRYAIGEIVLVVLGILIALQINTWNQQRIKDARFEYGLKSLYSEIQGAVYMQSGVIDRLLFQLECIDRLLTSPDSIPTHEIPFMLTVLDETAIIEWDNSWKRKYLEFDMNRPDRNYFVTALQGLTDTSSQLNKTLETNELLNAFKGYLRQYNIPYELYYGNVGTNYRDFIGYGSDSIYNPVQQEAIRALLKDPSFQADLFTIKGIKKGMLDFSYSTSNNASAFLNYIKSYAPDTDYSLQRMEIIGPGLLNGNWATGILMEKVDPENDSRWQIEQRLVPGRIKFRTDASWALDWGRGQMGKTLVFKGGDIPTEAGLYRISIDILERTYRFEKLEE